VDSDQPRLAAICRGIVEKIAAAKRPVIMAGSGVRVAGAVDVFQRVIAKLGIPVTTAWTHDTIATAPVVLRASRQHRGPPRQFHGAKQRPFAGDRFATGISGRSATTGVSLLARL